MFNNTNRIQNSFDTYIANVARIEEMLSRWDSESEKFSHIFKKIRENFSKKAEDFYREDRKLSIAVIGQVKAGKSSFLNTLLFDGKDILPKAATPKTANLTKIKYGEENSIEIDFYTQDEWKELERLAAVDGESDEIKVAKEIKKMVTDRNIDIYKYIGKSDYKIKFESYEELLGKLNEYAGENGELTPIVKSLIMTVNNENIKTIEIVDTPGMNDPIVSRTDKTRQFIELCDVAFFLSRCPKFLDKTDMELLTRQLPQKGVSRLILIGSQYDSSINDVIWDKGSFDVADVDNKKRLKERANKEFSELIRRMSQKDPNSNIVRVIEGCKVPILVSSMAHNMSKKENYKFNEEELIVFNGINDINEFTKEMQRKLGNFDKVNKVFNEVIEQKDLTLADKAKNFIPTSVSDCKAELDALNSKINKRAMLLEQNDITLLQKSRKETLGKKNTIHAEVENVFGGLLVKLDRVRVELFAALRKDINNSKSLEERTGTEEKTGYKEVSTSKWYNPFSWGDKDYVAYTYTSTYTYLDVSDAIESIRNYANESSSGIERRLNETIDFSKSKRELLSVIVNNFETTDDSFDPAYFRLLVEKTLNLIETPVIKLDIGKEMKEISSNFSGEIRDGAQKSAMRIALSEALGNTYSAMEQILIDEFKKMKVTITKLRDTLADQLVSDIAKELEMIESQFKDRENELKRNKEFITDIGRAIEIIVKV